MRRLLWAYRLCMVVALPAGALFLLFHGAAALLALLFDRLAFHAVPPDIALISLFSLACLAAVIYEKLILPRRALSSHSSLPDQADETNREAADLSPVFLELQSCCPSAKKDEDSFWIPFRNPDHGVYCQLWNGDLIVGLLDSPHHEHFSEVWGQDVSQAVKEELDDILEERAVQMIFYDRKGGEHGNDLYPADKIDSEIAARLHPLSSPQPWWNRVLKLLFLKFPPFEPRIVRAGVFSAKGTFDRTVPPSRPS